MCKDVRLKISAFLASSVALFSRAPEVLVDTFPELPVEQKKKEFDFAKDSLEALWHGSNPSEISHVNDDYVTYALSNYHISSGSPSKAFDLLQAHNSSDNLRLAELQAKALFSQQKFLELLKLPIFTAEPKKDLSWETLLIGAMVNEEVGRLQVSERYFDHLVTANPDNEKIMHQALLSKLKRGKVTDAFNHVEKFLARVNLKSKHAIFYQLKAAMLTSSPFLDFNQALDVLDQGLKIAPNNPKLLHMKFVLHEQLGQKVMASQSLHKLVKVTDQPEFRKAFILRSFKEKEFGKALEEIEALQDASVGMLFNKAVLYSKMHDYERSLDALNLCLKQDPKYGNALILKQNVLVKLNRYDQALSNLVDMLALQPNSGYLISGILSLAKRSQEPLKIASRLYEMSNEGKNVGLCIAAADFCLKSKTFDFAIQLYDQLLDKKIPNKIAMSKILYGKAKSMQSLDMEPEKVKHVLYSCTEACPQLAFPYQLLARLHRSEDKESNLKALQYINRAIGLFPLHGDFYKDKGSLLVSLGYHCQGLYANLQARLTDPFSLVQ